MRVYHLPVLSNKQVSERYWHMVVGTSSIKETIEPGQFFNVRCGEADFPFLRRPFSVYLINESTLEFLYLVKGAGTKELTLVKPGGKVDIFGPLGKPFSIEPYCRTILLLARGVGIATLAALAQRATEKGIKTVAILSARTNNDLLAAEKLSGFGTEVYKVTEEDNTSDVPNVRQLVQDLQRKHCIDAFYTCGSKRLSKLLQEIAVNENIPAQIAMEEHMGCAMGVCYACVCDIEQDGKIHSVKVCKDGPVFPLEKVVLG